MQKISTKCKLKTLEIGNEEIAIACGETVEPVSGENLMRLWGGRARNDRAVFDSESSILGGETA